MGTSLTPLITLVIMFVIFYFILIRPQQKRQKEVRNMQAELKKGDSIITIGGIHGEIQAVDENTVVISTGDGVKLTFDRHAIREMTSAQ